MSTLLHQGFHYIKNVRVEIVSKFTEKPYSYRSQNSGYDYSNAHYQSSNGFYDHESYIEDHNQGQFGRPGLDHLTAQDQSRMGYEDKRGYSDKFGSHVPGKKQFNSDRYQNQRAAANPSQPYTQDKYSEHYESQPISAKSASTSTKLATSVSEYSYGDAESRSSQAFKPLDGENPSQGFPKKLQVSKKEMSGPQQLSAKKHLAPSQVAHMPNSEFGTELLIPPQEASRLKPAKPTNRTDSEFGTLAGTENGQAAGAKTPSSRGQRQLSSKNTSDFYPQESQGTTPSVADKLQDSNGSKHPIWLSPSPANALPIWPTSGEFVQSQVAAAQGLGYIVPPYGYPPSTSLPTFPAALFYEEAQNPLEPAKRREWSISYYAFPGLV